MRLPRMKVSEPGQVGCYHCVSRVVDRSRVFGEVEKDMLVSLMRESEAFSRVQVLTYCVMSDHFHLLVMVEKRPETLPGPAEVLASMRRMTGLTGADLLEEQLAAHRESGNHEAARALLEKQYERMWDVSPFMKLLKQRFTQWFNGRKGRRGTLWDQRFKSVVVEGEGLGLGAMAAYIDLNPVRAGLVKDPKDYRWSGYGEAMAGKRRAREGIAAVVKGLLGEQESVAESLVVYGELMRGPDPEKGEEGNESERALSRKAALRILEKRGKLELADYLRCRVRYFSDGAVFGSRAFVERVFESQRDRFGPERKSGARKVRGLAGAELYTVRQLQVKVFG